LHNDTSHFTRTVIVVAGPTAVGKTAFAIELARHFGAEIISADSRQCYRELSIGVARPSPDELAAVPHHFIATHSVTDDLNAGSFEQYALEKAADLFEKNPVVVMVGGTGLYIKAFCEGIDPMPEVPPAVRAQVISGYESKGLIWLQKELQIKDPDFWKVAEQQNPQRLMRALEVLYATGESILRFRTAAVRERPFRIIKTALELPRPQLNERIDRRVDQMMTAGLLEEARSVIAYRNHNALQTVGYRECFDHLDGTITLNDMVQQIKNHTRQYAKRQMTWFRKDPGFTWVAPDPAGLESILRHVHP
jgi:tRNA dimethylallyltransferase